MPDEETLVCRIQNGGDDANDLALCGHQRPAGASGIYRGVELDEIRQQALPLRRAEFAPQTGHYSRRHRRTDAEWKADGNDLIAQCEVRGGSHGGREKIVGNRLRLKHGQIVLRPHAGDRGIGFEPVGEHHLHPLGAEHDVEIGEDDAFVDDDNPGADALLDVLVRLCQVPTHARERSTVE